MVKRISLLLFSFCILFATEKTFIRDYTYQASDYDSKVTSRANALEQVKRLLLEEVSVFMKSEVDWTKTEELIEGKYELKDFYEKKITSITAGVTKTKVLDEKWTGEEYWIKAEITLDLDDIDRKVSDIINSREEIIDMLDELKDAKKKADDALIEIERLKKELAEEKSDAEQVRLTKAYNREIDALSATDWFNKAHNARLNKESEKAISFFKKAIELDPISDLAPNAQYIVSDIYFIDLRNFETAIQEYRKVNDLYSDSKQSPLALFMIGYIYNNIFYNSKYAKDTYTTFLKEFPNHELVPSIFFELDNLGLTLQELKNKYGENLEKYKNRSIEELKDIWGHNYEDYLKKFK